MPAITVLVVFVFIVPWLVACGTSPCPEGSVATHEGRCAVEEEAPPWTWASDADVPALDAGAGTGTDAGPGAPTCVAESSFDLPDLARIDANCDGIDGELDTSAFVATSGDDANDGLAPERPVRTIAHGIAVASAAGRSAVLVAHGTYAERIALAESIGVHGGYEAPTWARTGGATIVRADDTVVEAEGIALETVVSELTVRREDAVLGESSIAMRIVRSTGIVLESVVVIAGRGGRGAPAAAPDLVVDGIVRGAPGRNGSRGADSARSGLSSCTVDSFEPTGGTGGAAPVGACGAGGHGGRGGRHFTTALGELPAQMGQAGAHPAPVSGRCPLHTGAAGGHAGIDSLYAGPRYGQPGAHGAVGRHGGSGVGGTSVGVLWETGYAPRDGTSGAHGAHGEGGGGGGGGHGCVIGSFCIASGGGGGGGGSGGVGGVAGNGGSGGAASIGILAWESALHMRHTSITVLGGGDGGVASRPTTGGVGGLGGAGGYASVYGGCLTGVGGPGGNGGDGGIGGAGGGGGGGPSFGIVLGAGSEITDGSTEVVYDIAPGGAGGASTDPMSAGAEGIAAETYSP